MARPGQAHLALACDPIDGLACNMGPAVTEPCLPVAVSSRSDSRTGVHIITAEGGPGAGEVTTKSKGGAEGDWCRHCVAP